MASAITSRTTKVPDTSPRSPMMQQPLRTSMIGVGFRDARKSLELYGPPRRPFPSPVSASVVSKPVLESEEESPGNGETSFNLIPSESAVEGREDVVQRPATPTPPAMPPRSFSSWPAASDVLDLYLGGRLSRNPDPKSAPILGKGIIATLPVPALPTFEEAASRQRNQSSPASVPAKRPRADTTSNVDITPTQVATISTTDDTRRSTSASVEEWRKGVILDSEEQEQTERRIKRCKLESDLAEYYDDTRPTLEFPQNFGFQKDNCDAGTAADSSSSTSQSTVAADERSCTPELADVVEKNKLVLNNYVFEPTAEVFEDFENFVRVIESSGASRNGVIKVIVPKEFRAKFPNGIDAAHPSLRPDYNEPIDNTAHSQPDVKSSARFPAKKRRSGGSMVVYVQQLRSLPGQHEIYEIHSTQHLFGEPKDWTSLSDYAYRPHPRSESEFLQLANFSPKNGSNKVWYSTDNNATNYLRKYFSLPDIGVQNFPGNVIQDTKERIEGIHSPFLYFARKFTCFAMHIEDFGAHSINFLHAGNAKRWIVINPADAHKVENLLSSHGTAGSASSTITCSQFVRHKSVFIPTATLRKHGIRYTEITQKAGEMVITFPYAYHQGWNTGRNCAEAIAWGNQAWKERWIKNYESCKAGICTDAEPITFTWDE